MSTFATEDARKDTLFKGWIEYLKEIHSKHATDDFEEIYQGYAMVTSRSKNRISFELDDGRRLRHIHISPAIGEYTRGLDHMFVVLGKLGDRWMPLDVLSIGSIISFETGQVHFSVNPLYVQGKLKKETIH